MQPSPVILGITRDLVSADGALAFPGYPLSEILSTPGLLSRHIDLAPGHDPTELAALDLLISVPHGAPIADGVISAMKSLVAVIRVGVGYEDCDVDALSRAGIALVIPTHATQRPTAVAALTLILALATRLLDKHRLTFAAQEGWDRRSSVRGSDLRGKTLGLVGCGAIGRELITIARPLGLHFLIHDPALTAGDALDQDCRVCSLDELMAQSDFVSIHCPLNAETNRLIDARRIGLMKGSAYLINTARGGIIEQYALARALEEGRIAGAGLDVFDPEPLPPDDPLLRLDNVVLSGHALNWTCELDKALGQVNHAAIISLLAGAVPDGVVNRSVLDDVRFRAKLESIGRRHQEHVEFDHTARGAST